MTFGIDIDLAQDRRDRELRRGPWDDDAEDVGCCICGDRCSTEDAALAQWFNVDHWICRACQCAIDEDRVEVTP